MRLFSYLWTSKIKSMDKEEIEMAKSQRLERIENEVSALGCHLARQYVILSGDGYVVESFSTLNEVERWLGREELRRLGDTGGDDE